VSEPTHESMNQKFERWAETERRNRKLAVELVLKIMKQHNIKCVACTYCGEGDDGQMEDFYVLTEPIEPEAIYNLEGKVDAAGEKLLSETAPDPELCKIDLFTRWCSPPASLQELIEFMASYVTPEGYENGNGGQGTIVFDAVNNLAAMEHGTNHIEVDYTTEEIDLEEDEDADAESSSSL